MLSLSPLGEDNWEALHLEFSWPLFYASVPLADLNLYPFAVIKHK